jgi:hypothetical protein
MPRGKAQSTPPIVLLTDFGYQDHYAGVMRGVIASIAPGTPVIDLTHGIPAHSVTAGALALAQSWRHFPPRSIFAGVVDPGVGTTRRAIALETASGARFIGPDNGLLTLAADAAGLKRTVELREARYRLDVVSATFHGRDVFAPAAAHLARGVRLASLGPAASSLIRIDPAAGVIEGEDSLRGSIIYVDGFGNLITNLDRARLDGLKARFRGGRLLARIRRGAPIPILSAYGDASPGGPLACLGSFDLLEIAIRDGNAATHFGATPGIPVTVKVKS